MSLITTIEQVRAVIGSAVRQENTFEILKPYLAKAERELVTGLIGTAQMAALAGEQQGKMATLKTLAENAIIWNGYQDAWYQSFYQFTGSGVNKQKIDKVESLFRYQEDGIQKDVIKKADEAIETLMSFLEVNSPEFSQNFGYLISTPAALHRALPQVSKSYRMYNVLRGYMDAVELKTVKTVTGVGLYMNLKEKIRTGVGLDGNYKELLKLCQEYAAPAVLLAAMPWIRVQFSPSGVRIASVFNNLQDETPLKDDQVDWLMGILKTQIDQAKTALRMYLNGTAGPGVFPEYYASELYRTPDSRKWTMPDNEGRNHFRL
jgi:hypothetical protein